MNNQCINQFVSTQWVFWLGFEIYESLIVQSTTCVQQRDMLLHVHVARGCVVVL